jgi:general secretion pathway protein F
LEFLVVFIIPKFSNIYQSQVKNISASTQFLLDVGQFSQHYGGVLMVMVVGLIFGLVITFARKESRQQLLAWCWRVPVIGEHIRIYTLTRFYRTMAMLLKSGIPVLQSLSMVDNLLGAQLKQQLAETKKMVSEGQAFSTAMQKNGLLTPVATRLFQVGEQTGTLDLMMARAASFHEEQMVRWIDRFIKILEPSLMALIGVLIGGIVLLMYMPIFELASGIE